MLGSFCYDTGMKDLFKQPIVAGSLVLALSLFLAVIVASYTAYGIRSMDNALSVTGSAKQSIEADQVKWTLNVSKPITASSMKEGYNEIDRQLKVVKNFLTKNGFTENDLSISTVFMEEVYEQNIPAPEYKKYNLRQSVTLTSKDVQRVDVLSKNIREIVEQGVLLSALSPEYSYSGLANLRVTLLSAALKDAESRAESIASVSGNRVGKLKSASSGVVQVLPQGSNDVSDYGTYDTTTIRKDVMVTVRASFAVK